MTLIKFIRKLQSDGETSIRISKNFIGSLSDRQIDRQVIDVVNNIFPGFHPRQPAAPFQGKNKRKTSLVWTRID